MPRGTRACSGFTLVELLVTLGVMALMAALVWRGIDGMQRAQQHVQERTQLLGALQTGMQQWNADLDAILVPTARTSMLLQEPQALEWTGAALRLTRMDANAWDGALRVVAWSVKNSDGHQRWCRWQSDLLRTQAQWRAAWEASGRWLQQADVSVVGKGAATAPHTCVADIAQWQVFFFRGNAWSNAASSADLDRSAPDGVRLWLTLSDSQAYTGPLTQDWVRPTLAGHKS